jgi:hypothetical protein
MAKSGNNGVMAAIIGRIRRGGAGENSGSAANKRKASVNAHVRWRLAAIGISLNGNHGENGEKYLA